MCSNSFRGFEPKLVLRACQQVYPDGPYATKLCIKGTKAMRVGAQDKQQTASKYCIVASCSFNQVHPTAVVVPPVAMPQQHAADGMLIHGPQLPSCSAQQRASGWLVSESKPVTIRTPCMPSSTCMHGQMQAAGIVLPWACGECYQQTWSACKHAAFLLAAFMCDTWEAGVMAAGNAPALLCVLQNTFSDVDIDLFYNVSNLNCTAQYPTAEWRDTCEIAGMTALAAAAVLLESAAVLGNWMPQGVSTINGDKVMDIGVTCAGVFWLALRQVPHQWLQHKRGDACKGP